MQAQTPETIARDFDRIARLPSDPWDHNRMYLGVLLREIPARLGDALEIGCGTGELTALLAARAQRVLALDLSPEMLAAARARCAGAGNAELVLADAATFPLPREGFDAIASVATFHHLELAPLLGRLRDALRPGGVLAVLDVIADHSPATVAVSALTAPINLLGRLVTTGRLRPSAEQRAAWEAHAASDRFPPLAEVRAAAAEILPGARVRRHLFWRYSLRWRKPGH